MTDPELLEMPAPAASAPIPSARASSGTADAPPSRVGRMAGGLQGSSILRVAAQVRAMIAQGEPVVNLTVGDFSPAEFPVPAALVEFVTEALRSGETNYPPSTGVPQLRSAVARFYERRLGLRFGENGILIAAGARPGIYSAYRVLVDPGDRVVFPVPSWNNPEYCQLVDAVAVPVACDASTGFLPTARALAPVLRDARLLVLNSPVNPTGTAFEADALRDICDTVLEENARREARGIDRPLFVLYDQVYWMLTFHGLRHVHPVGLRDDMGRYTVYVDAISKAFAATGLRVGWISGPDDVMKAAGDVLGHSGAWAPRAEQIATARLLADGALVDAYHAEMLTAVRRRLDALYAGLAAMRAEGLPVDVAEPLATIYLSARFALTGRRTADGTVLRDDEAVRAYLLHRAGFAAVPFRAFGVRGDSGWFRLSVGAVSMPQIEAVMPRLRAAIAELADVP
ncbi:MAG TPA: aminotransferase class I/II-fold pyridoxal phosphate-dependent enzyme [Gemmatimonadaceae bacterium]|nr:aminotransferase class I/II-fold pyridoxal phosphate-dependent enzyme [Gemmatimonadaceae bacterium]